MSLPESRSTSALRWYLTASALWFGAIHLQMFLITWMLVGILREPADRVGTGRALIEIPALAVLLVGGLLGDRTEVRAFLGRMHVFAAVPALMLGMLAYFDLVTFWAVIAFGFAVNGLHCLSEPARQAAQTRLAPGAAQRAVAMSNLVNFCAGLGALALAAQLERQGAHVVLAVQAALFLAGALAARRLPVLALAGGTVRPRLLDGLRAVRAIRNIRDLVLFNSVTSFMNVGAYVIALPFIARDLYGADARVFAWLMMVFTAGTIGSNLLLLRLMPLARPGRWFASLQLTRSFILLVIWLQPPLWAFFLAVFAWGWNVGVNMAVTRSIMQELAPEAVRAQVLALFLLSFMLAAPVGAFALGHLITVTSPLAPMLLAIAASLLVGALAVSYSGLWTYRSPGTFAEAADPAASDPLPHA